MPNPLHDPDYRGLACLLRDLRVDAGVKQSELAAGIGRPQSFVSKYESGERRLDLIEVRKICHLLGTDLVSFVARLEGATDPTQAMRSER